MARSTFVYVTYIRTTPEKLWSALTDAEFMKQYWFGNHCESQRTVGSSWKNVHPDGRITDVGEIVEAEQPRRLVIRWQHDAPLGKQNRDGADRDTGKQDGGDARGMAEKTPANTCHR
jgi:uncharacterized protein YndB with AHSA1/START domain